MCAPHQTKTRHARTRLINFSASTYPTYPYRRRRSHPHTDVSDEKRLAWLHTRAEAADERRHELGAQTAHEASVWAVDALGPVPDVEQVVARQDWEHRAGWASAYRELVGHTDEHDPLGAAPGKGRVEHAVLFRAAHEALALIDAGDEEANMSDGQLRARVRGYERELNWAPRYVADELDATRQRASKVEADTVIWAARAEAPEMNPADAQQLRADADAARDEVEHLRRLVAELEIVDEARDRWYTETAVTRDYAERSRAELRARGVDPACTADLVTAAEWLQADRAAAADDDTHRDIRDEHELHDPQPYTDARGGADIHHTASSAPDVRETSTPDPTEIRDRRERHRVPKLHEMAEAVARAQEALWEIAVRQAADDARAAQDLTGRAAAEAARRDELTRWSADELGGAELEAGHDDTRGFADHPPLPR